MPIASSCNILLTDSSGEMVVVECNPLEIHIRYPEKNKKNEEFIVTVNHFTSKKMRKYDASDFNVYFSETRYQTAYNALKNIDYIDGIEHAKAILRGKYGFMCQYNKALKFELFGLQYLIFLAIRFIWLMVILKEQSTLKIKDF